MVFMRRQALPDVPDKALATQLDFQAFD